jgi:hypothetical protein
MHRIPIMPMSVVTTILLTVTIAGAEPALVKGYGETQWGQSLEEVAAVVDGKKGENLGASRQGIEMSRYVSTEGKADSTEYRFINDMLFDVTAYFRLADAPEDSTDNIGYGVVQEMIAEKYYKDEATRTALQAAQIRVQAAMTPDGQIIAMYSNSRISREVHAAIKKKQEEARKQVLESADERCEKILASDLADRL